MASTPPGRSSRKASANTAAVAACGSSWHTRERDTRSAESAGKRVSSACACTYCTREVGGGLPAAAACDKTANVVQAGYRCKMGGCLGIIF